MLLVRDAEGGARRVQERVDEMIAHLAGLAEERVLLSFAPSTPYYEVLKRVGELFPKGAKVCSAFSHVCIITITTGVVPGRHAYAQARPRLPCVCFMVTVIWQISSYTSFGLDRW